MTRDTPQTVVTESKSLSVDWSYFLKSYMLGIFSSLQMNCSFAMIIETDESLRVRLQSFSLQLIHVSESWHSAWVSKRREIIRFPSIESLGQNEANRVECFRKQNKIFLFLWTPRVSESQPWSRIEEDFHHRCSIFSLDRKQIFRTIGTIC